MPYVIPFPDIDPVLVSFQLFGIVLAQGPPLVWPGESAVAVAFSTLFEPGTERLAQAGTFTLFEGRRIVGRGRVLGRLRDGA